MKRSWHAAGLRRGRQGPDLEQGAASILIVSVLGLLGTLAVMSWAAAALAEQGSAMTQTRMLQVRAAAESGLAWALTRLNEAGVHDRHCTPYAAAVSGAAASDTAMRKKIPWASAPMGAQPAAHWACFADDRASGGWRCSCPATVDAPWDPTWLELARASGHSASRAAFVVSLLTPALPNHAPRLVSRGCADSSASCVPPSPADAANSVAPSGDESERPAGHAVASIALSQRTAMRQLPGAALIARDGVQAGAGVSVANLGADSGGRVIWSGAAVDLAAAQVRGLPGAPPSDGIIPVDPALAALSGESMARAWLGLSPETWGLHPTVRRVRCTVDGGSCSAQVNAAIQQGAALIHVQGDLRWQPAPADLLPWASDSSPVMLVVEGALSIFGPADLRLVAMARDLEVDGRTGSVQWQGAALAAGRVSLMGSVSLRRDAQVIERLAREPLAIQAQAGSWHEP